jgi:hypothetical protein
LAAAAGFTCLAYDVDGWAVFFLVLAALEFASAYWLFTIARSRTAKA